MKRYAGICIVLASVLPAFGYTLGGSWLGAAASVGLGFLWLAGMGRAWQGAATLGLVGFAGIAAWGVWLELDTPILIAGLVAVLLAWDLDRFAQRLRSAGHVEGQHALARAHLQRLLIVAGLGLLLGLVAGGIQVTLSFGWVLGLGALAILGLSRAIRSLSSTGE